jgi:hypothetical protein
MGAKKMIFPIALAIVWMLMAALAMADFASFTSATQPRHSQQIVQGRNGTRLARN